MPRVLAIESGPVCVCNVQRYGYTQLSLIELMVADTRRLEVPRPVYCEVGFKSGHSAAAVLMADDDLRVHSFDMCVNSYCLPNAQLLSLHFFGRFVLHVGDSLLTVPSFGQSQAQDDQGGLTCDILLIDGGHTEECVFKDVMNFYKVRLVRVRSCAQHRLRFRV